MQISLGIAITSGDRRTAGGSGGPATAPGKVSGLVATAGTGEVVLTWNVPASGGSTITDYVIEMNSGSGFAVISDSVSTTPSHTVTNLADSTAYTFRVSAKNAVGTGAKSDTATATPESGASVPGAITTIGAIAQDAEVGLTWSAPASDGGSTITGYQIQRQAGGGAWGTLASDTSPDTATSYTDTSVANGTTYGYRVRAKNAVGFASQWSSVASATPVAAPSLPSAPLASLRSQGRARSYCRGRRLPTMAARPSQTTSSRSARTAALTPP